MEDTSNNLSNLSDFLENMDISAGELLNLNVSLESANSESRDIDADSIIDRVMQHYIRHNLTLVCVEDTFKLLNFISDSKKKLPVTKYHIMRQFEERVSIHLNREIYIKCINCNIYSKASSVRREGACTQCEKHLVCGETNFFVYMPLEKQILHCLKLNWPIIQDYIDKNHDSSDITDVHNADFLKKLYKKNKRKNSDRKLLSLVLNTDGANKFKSNTLSVWPIQLILNFLPPEHRYIPKNILTVGLYYGVTKPNCWSYFYPLTNEIKQLQKEGISLEIDDQILVFEPVISHCVVDLPAKSMLQCIKQYNGRNACTYCRHPGTSVPTAGKKMIRYPVADEVYEDRTNDATLSAMLEKNQIDGVMDVSCLVSLPSFEIINGFGVDYMHCILLGVTRKLLDLYLNTKNHKKSFYINKAKLAILDRRLLSIKAIIEISRKPRSLKHRSDFKASEFIYILLYYFPVCLIGILKPKYLVNFQRLSSAIYLLLKSKITREDIINAEEQLNIFVEEFELLFGRDNMVMNIHLITHIVDSVKHLGPLWAQSAFGFERNNGCLLKLINGTSDVLEQISNKYIIQKFLQKSILHKNERTVFLGRYEYISEESMTVYDNESDKCIRLENTEFPVYKRIEINGTVYTSLLYDRPKKTADYFVGLKNGVIGIVKYFVCTNNIKYAFLQEFEIMECIGHVLNVEPSTINIYAPVDSIIEKYIYMYIQNKHYVCTPPNNIENE